VWAAEPDSGVLRPTVASRVFSTGTRSVFRLVTRVGRSVRATANHRFLTLEGWRRLDELRAGERLAIPRRTNSPLQRRSLDRELADGGESDIHWDELATIVPDGDEEVFDLTVPGPHNFVADDIVVHNSIEQDADLVAFVYRDELYNPDDPSNKGLAELILAKHRNGETGTVELVFLGETTTFKNRAPDYMLSGGPQY
jgi:replicative DNA helicase